MNHDSVSALENRKGQCSLSAREAEVVGFVARGLCSKDIARTLKISPKTVESYIEHARLKLNAHNRAHLIVMAVREGLLNVQAIASVEEDARQVRPTFATLGSKLLEVRARR